LLTSNATGVLIQCDESIMAVIRKIDNAKNDFIIEELDDETCLIKENKLEELKQRLKEVS
jgi:TFIIH basal transcription factor complex TTD-A subunit